MIFDEKCVFVLLLLLISIRDAVLNEDGYTVGCVKCHSLHTDKINVHLVPHSHDDVGWLKTFEEYYFGLNNEAVGQPAAVQNIISTVVEELLKNPDRRFIQVETSFFYKWWQHQNPDVQNNFKKLVDNGQIEIVSGGWSMNDEASTNYQSTIDQFTLGLRKIEETIGKCGRSKIGWQIDTFGHSRQQASISAQLGFDGLFFARLDHDDLAKRQREHRMDFVWKGSANLDNNIFSSIFPENGYGSPYGFCWDINCGNDQIVDDPDSILYNVPEKVKAFTDVLDRYSKFYSIENKNIFITMGGDFQYQAADFQFENIDKLIKGFSNHTKYNVFYSTPSCYVKAVHDANATLSVKNDDFFPYSDHNHTFWAGYFTSRPNLKRFERVGHQILQATKQIYALGSDRNNDHLLNDLNEAMGIVQHHDAITGTEKQAVSDDYVRMLTAAIKKAEEPTGRIINDILKGHPDVKLSLSSCLLSNVSICSISQNSDQFVVVVYNPLAWKTKYYVRLPVEKNRYAVDGPDGQQVFDLIPSLSRFKFVEIKNETPSSYELVFEALDIPPMGFKVYHIQKLRYLPSQEKKLHSSPEMDFLQVNKDSFQLNLGFNNIALNVTQSFLYYKSSNGSDNSDNTPSGAYIFAPQQDPPTPLPQPRIIGTYNGSLLKEVHINWTDENVEAYQSIRWYNNEDYIEFNWLVGNINVNLNKGKEVITRLNFANVDNDNIFYTDSNGRETIQRIRNARSDYNYTPSLEPVASNYYPVTSKIVIKDVRRNIQIAILNDRAQGGSSLDNNQVELMLHRRLAYDDKRGVGEALDEKEFSKQLGMYARGSFYLMYGKINDTTSNGKSMTAQERIFAHKKLLEPWVGLSPTQVSFLELESAINLTYSALNKELPENINILSFERWTNESFLLRLEHIMEKNDDFNLSQPATVDLRHLFKKMDLTNIVETTLGANIPLSEFSQTPRYKWKTENYMDAPSHSRSNQSGNIEDGRITLNPMEIRTFIVSPSHYISAGIIVSTNIILSIFLLILIHFIHFLHLM